MAITFEKVLVLKNIPFFAKASEMALADLIAVAEERTLKAGEVIADDKTENHWLYMILAGTVHLKEGKEVVGELGPRQVFGETTVLSPAPLPYQVVAHDKVTLLRVEGDQLCRMMSLHPTLGKGFIGELSQRLRAVQMKNL